MRFAMSGREDEVFAESRGNGAERAMSLVVTGPSLSLVGGQVRHIAILREVARQCGLEFAFVPIGYRPGESGIHRRALRLVADAITLARCVARQRRERALPAFVHLNSSVQVASLLRDGLLLIAARIGGARRVLIQFHGCLLTDAHSGSRHLRWLCHRVMDGCDRVVVLSGTQESAIAYRGTTPVVVIRNGVDLQPVPVLPPRRLAATRCRALFVGRVTGEKGVAIAIHAIAVLNGRGRHVELSVLGDGDELLRLQALAAELGVDAVVRFYGSCPADAVRQAMMAHDVLLFPSLIPEGVPYVLIEALEAGLPVVATVSSGAIQEMVDLAGGAIIRSDPDADSFASTIESLLSANRLAPLGLQARHAAEQNFSVATLLPQWLEAWQCVDDRTNNLSD